MPANIKIDVNVAPAQYAIRAFRQKAIAVVDRELGEAHETARRRFKGMYYPPQRPGQRYVRTGQYANRWAKSRVKMTATTSQWQLTNKSVGRRGQHYASYVGGDDEGRQAWMHRGRWWVALYNYADQVQRVKARIERALVQLWNSMGH